MAKLRPRVGRRFVAMLLVVVGAVVFTVRLVDIQVVSASELNSDAALKRAVRIADDDGIATV